MLGNVAFAAVPNALVFRGKTMQPMLNWQPHASILMFFRVGKVNGKVLGSKSWGHFFHKLQYIAKSLETSGVTPYLPLERM